MPDSGIRRLDGHRFAQQFGALLILATHPVEVGEVRQGGDEIRVEPQRRAVLASAAVCRCWRRRTSRPRFRCASGRSASIISAATNSWMALSSAVR